MDNAKKELKALMDKLGTFESATFSEQGRFLNELRQFIKDKNLKIDLDADLDSAEHHLCVAFFYYQEIIKLVFDVYSHKVSGGQNPAKGAV